MAKKAKKISLKLLLRLIVAFLTFIIPLMLVVVTVYIFNQTRKIKKKVIEKKEVVEEQLTPSQILGNKAKYSQQKIVIRGRVKPEEAVCERRECPADDPCCGCPPEKDLIIYDADVVLTSKTGGRLRLLDSKGKSFCQRRQLKCDYHCQDWIGGAIYNVSGLFYAEPPPPGWKLSLDYYLQVESKELVKRVGFVELLGNLLREIKEMVARIKTSGYYILP